MYFFYLSNILVGIRPEKSQHIDFDYDRRETLSDYVFFLNAFNQMIKNRSHPVTQFNIIERIDSNLHLYIFF